MHLIYLAKTIFERLKENLLSRGMLFFERSIFKFLLIPKPSVRPSLNKTIIFILYISTGNDHLWIAIPVNLLFLKRKQPQAKPQKSKHAQVA